MLLYAKGCCTWVNQLTKHFANTEYLEIQEVNRRKRTWEIQVKLFIEFLSRGKSQRLVFVTKTSVLSHKPWEVSELGPPSFLFLVPFVTDA